MSGALNKQRLAIGGMIWDLLSLRGAGEGLPEELGRS